MYDATFRNSAGKIGVIWVDGEVDYLAQLWKRLMDHLEGFSEAIIRPNLFLMPHQDVRT
jgi:hypothetical protein